IVIFFHLVFYYNSRNNVLPTFLVIFDMIGGRLCPADIGLDDSYFIKTFAKMSKMLFKCCSLMTERAYYMGTFLLIIYVSKCSLIESVFYGIVNSVHFGLLCYYGTNIGLWTSLYLYLMCNYLKHKLRQINRQLVARMRNDRTFSVAYMTRTMRSLNAIYAEI